MRRAFGLACFSLLLLVVVSTPTVASGSLPERTVRVGWAVTGDGLPADLLHPEGTTRWHLDTLSAAATGVVTTRAAGDAVVVEGLPGGTVSYRDPKGGDAAARWLYPDRFPEDLKPGARRALLVERTVDGAAARLWIEVTTLGPGWVHLPSGPREAVLQRALVLRADGRGYRPDRFLHRWVDPRAGVVAEASGPASSDGLSAASVDTVTYAEDVITGAADLKIYVDDLESLPLTKVNYGWELGEGTPISSLVPDPVTTMADLEALDHWDFSGNTTGTEIAATTVPLDATETCNAGQCGYTIGADLGRNDFNFDDPNPDNQRHDNQIEEREDFPDHVTIWLRAGAQREGINECFGNGESRFCYTGTDSNGKARTPAPDWEFHKQDAGGWYINADPLDPDLWNSGPIDCEQTIFNTICGADPPIWCLTPAKMYAGGSLSGFCSNQCGQQYGGVVKSGVVTLPSGHTLNALLVRQVADFCVYSGSSCGFLGKVSEVMTVVDFWQVPHLQTVVLLQSPQDVGNIDPAACNDRTPPLDFTTVDHTNITFGLYPPLTITVTGTTDTTVDLSWDPGADTHRITGYKVYWDTDPGADTPYAFNSDDNASQVTFVGTTATISGLDPATTYYFTVTSLSNFTDPSSGVITTYESIVYPTQVYGDPDFVYPIEVLATTTGGCIPQEEVTGVTIGKVTEGIQICWDPASDPCVVGYRVLGADSPEAAANFSSLAETGLETCWTGNPAQSYFLVVSRGTGGDGPWGHYNQ